uniref:Uncharacterized protein MANES_14G133300 n=1 Tax=Rhizophora mucronata TaxID=61149 RepID=A0A2P2JQ80_RHIMU
MYTPQLAKKTICLHGESKCENSLKISSHSLIYQLKHQDLQQNGYSGVAEFSDLSRWKRLRWQFQALTIPCVHSAFQGVYHSTPCQVKGI